MLRAARAARGSHPATPASARPAPVRVPSPIARLPAVLRAAPPSRGPLSVASTGRNGGAAQLALPTLSAHSAERALCGRESPSDLSRETLLMHGSSAAPARRDGAQRPPLFGASVSLALRPRASLGVGILRGLLCTDRLPLRGFSSSDSTASAAAADQAQVAPRTNKNFEIDGTLQFVDRYEEVFEIARVSIKNQLLPKGVHRTLVVADQMFGAGKTELGKNAVARAKLQRERLVGAFPADAVDNFLNAVTVMIELNMLLPPAGAVLDKYFAQVLLGAIKSTATTNSTADWAKKVINEDWSHAALQQVIDQQNSYEGMTMAVVQKFQQCTARGIFVHIDEVGALEGKLMPLFEPAPSSDTDLQRRLRPYYAFWDFLLPLLSTPRVYLFLTGKGAGFPLLRMGLLSIAKERQVISPSPLLPIIAGPLSTSDIDETLQCSVTRDPSTPVKKRITFASTAHKERFLMRLVEETAGQPRLVHYYLDAMSMKGVHINSDEAIEDALTQGNAHAVKPPQVAASYTPNGTANLFYSLLLLGALDVPLNTATLVKHGDEMVPLQLLVHKFDLYATPDKRFDVPSASTPVPSVLSNAVLSSPASTSSVPTTAATSTSGGQWIRIRVARFLLRRMYSVVDQHNKADERVKELVNRALPPFLLEQISSGLPVSVLGENQPLEWLVRFRIAILITLLGSQQTQQTWGQAVLAFADTDVGKEAVVRPEPLVELASLAPKVVSHPRYSNCISLDFNKMLHVSHLESYFNTLAKHSVVFVSSKSSSPDVLLRLESRLLCFACKFYSKSSSTVDWRMLQAEIGKAAHWHRLQPVTLVIVATQLDPEVVAMLPVNALAWRVVAGTTPKLDVPVGMEVLVLSEAGLSSLLGEQPLRGLRKLLVDRSDPDKLAMEMVQFASLMLRELAPGTGASLSPFELESFLRHEAKIKEANVKKYLPLLNENEVNEAVLRALASKSEEVIKAELKEWGVSAGGDRTMLVEAIAARFGGGGSRK